MIINCARGGIVNEADLNAALRSGKVGGRRPGRVRNRAARGAAALRARPGRVHARTWAPRPLEAQTNVAVQISEQILAFLKTGTIINAVNVPAVSGELLGKIGPLLTLVERMGCLLAQLCRGPAREIAIEYAGEFPEQDLSPVSTALLKGFLTPMVQDTVNFVNAKVMAGERGIKVSETRAPVRRVHQPRDRAGGGERDRPQRGRDHFRPQVPATGQDRELPPGAAARRSVRR